MRTKGQGMIIEIIIFGVVIFMSIAIFFLLTLSDSVEEENIDARLDGELGKVSGEAAMTYILQQHIDQETSSDNQYNSTFEEIVQAYFESNGDIKIEGEQFDRDEVRSDLEEYLEHTYPQSTVTMGTKVNYPGTRAVFNVSKGNEYISQRNGVARHGTDRWPKQTRKIPVSDGNVEIELWINR